MVRHQLHSVANSQNRNPQGKNLRIRMRRALVVNAGRSARENNAFRAERGGFLRRNVKLDDLRINLALANPARDDLRVLRTEIEDQDLRMRGRGALGHGCVSLIVRSSERSIGPKVPWPVMPRWSFSGTSWTVPCSSGSAQLPRKRVAAEKKAIAKAFKREEYFKSDD